MKQFFVFLYLVFLASCSLGDQLVSINKEIEYFETINSILTQRRHNYYNYTDLEIQSFKTPLHNNKSIEFSQGLELSSYHPAGYHIINIGDKSYLFFLKYSLFVAQIFPNVTKIYQSSGVLIHQINASLIYITIVKATIDYELCYLESNFVINCGIYQGNITTINYRQTPLQMSLEHNIVSSRLKHFHVQKHEGTYFYSLLLDQKEIFVYDSVGMEKSKFTSNAERVVKYLDHNPYPMIVGTDRIAFLEPFRGTQSSLGCPVVQGQVITAQVQTPFSNTFYLLTESQIVVMQYSLKKSQKHCKISHKIPIASGQSNLKMLYPTLILNDTFVNVTDTLSPPQLQLPLQLCHQNTYESQYRNNQHYLLHRCCNNNNCTSNLYLRSKKSVSSSKHYKYLIITLIIFGLALKFWNKKQKANSQGSEDVSSDPMVQYQRKMISEKKKNMTQNRK